MKQQKEKFRMKSNKKTIYFSTYDDINNPHYGGGGAIAVHEVAKRLARNHTLCILSWDYCGKKKETIDGVQYERFGMPFLSPRAAMFAYQLVLPFIARQKQFDIFFESFCPPFTTAFLPLYIKKPVVGLVHMLAAEDMERKYKLPFHVIQNKGLKLYDKMIVTSSEVGNKIHKISPKTMITIISNGIDAIIEKKRSRKKYILFLGRIEVDQKGIDLLLKAFQKFHQKNQKYKLFIAGSGDQRELDKMKYLIALSGLSDLILLKGKVSGIVKEKLLQEAACVVIPSRFETHSLVALEAMAHGAPVACFAIEGLSWIPETIAKKVAPFNVDSLASALGEVVTNKSVSDTMSNNGLVYSKHFTWNDIGKQYEEYVARVFKL